MRCSVCGRELVPADATHDGEPCTVGFFPCSLHPRQDAGNSLVLAWDRARLAQGSGRPATCWACESKLPDVVTEFCPVCGADQAPF